MPLNIDVRGHEKLSSDFAKIARAGKDTAPLMDKIGKSLKDRVNLDWKRERDPYGNVWKPLSPLTIAMRRGSGKDDAILHDKGRLQASVAHDFDRTSVTLGTNYGKAGRPDEKPIVALAHLFGATIRPKKPGGRLIIGRTMSSGKFKVFASRLQVDIPARPFLPIGPKLPDTYVRRVLREMARFMEAELGSVS